MKATSAPTVLPGTPFLLEKVDFQTYGDIIGRLRVDAWRNESGIDPVFFARPTWIEALDEDAEHWLITDNGLPVASGRLSLHTSVTDVPYAYLLPDYCQKKLSNILIATISRMVVVPSHRGHGFSTLLDRVRVAEGLAMGASVLTAATQLEFRQKALAKLGFNTLCDVRKAPERPDWPLYFMVYHAADPASPAPASRLF
ncbi:GNAT family N-acetyltransferase [Hymenobacter rubidus]|uniref:hypothetical protein n=1 Tax=Hymenobacter rubidus TaxID=1441626 RepID=UPI00191DB6D9|nr:hypothetical protein [Hymenobacter rubidus]